LRHRARGAFTAAAALFHEPLVGAWARHRHTPGRRDQFQSRPGGGGTWVWTPVIEYEAGRQRLTSKISSWQRLNGKSAYAVGDQVDILYDPRNPSRVTLDSWTIYIVFTLVIGAVMATMLRQPQ